MACHHLLGFLGTLNKGLQPRFGALCLQQLGLERESRERK